MRKLILQMQTSLDGFVASTDGNLDWARWSYGPEWTWGKELQAYHIDTTASADCVVLSDKMAQEGFIAHWNEMARHTENPESLFARNIAAARKVVFSRHLLEPAPDWTQTEITHDDLAEAITKLKRQPGKNIIAFGGVRFASALLAAGLVDEFHFIINPVALGAGHNIFAANEKSYRLQLIDATAYSDGIVVMRYSK